MNQQKYRFSCPRSSGPRQLERNLLFPQLTLRPSATHYSWWFVANKAKIFYRMSILWQRVDLWLSREISMLNPLNQLTKSWLCLKIQGIYEPTKLSIDICNYDLFIVWHPLMVKFWDLSRITQPGSIGRMVNILKLWITFSTHKKTFQ